MAGVGEPLGPVLSRAAAGKIPPILVTRFDPDRGEDLFGRDRLVREVTRAILEDTPPVFGRTVFETSVVTMSEVIDAAREVSLLAPRRLVLVRGGRLAGSEGGGDEGEHAPEGGAGGRAQGPGRAEGAGDGDAAQIAVLERYLRQASRSACILFVGCPWDGRRKVHKALLAAATVVDVSRPDPRQIPSWIAERVREAGGRIDQDAIALLADLRGNDTLRLAGEIEKLLLHAGSGAISSEDVAGLVVAGEAGSAWALVDAVAARDWDQALRTLRRLLEEGEPVPMIVGALASRLRQLVVLRDEATSGSRHEDARRIVFPGRSIYFADSLAGQAARFPPEALLEALASLYEVDRSSKSSSLDAGALLEQWLVSSLILRSRKHSVS